jgi:hypothetical protein
MARETGSGRGCDELDLFALWPCTPQLGCVPLSDILADAHNAGEGEAGTGWPPTGQPRVESD